LPVEERLGEQVLFMPDGCWHWTGAFFASGYGNIWIDEKPRRAHRAMYELLVGAIPDGLELDHTCGHKACVNPSHLEPVTHRENVLRSPSGFASVNARKTVCPRGHPYDEANTWRDTRGRRYCRTCQRASWKRAKERQRIERSHRKSERMDAGTTR
jgi:hypothetical protein